MAAKFLTETVARLAFEQIAAWYHDQSKGKPLPSRLSTEGLNEHFLKAALEGVHVDMKLLKDSGIAEEKVEKVGPCGLTDYFRDESTYKIDMAALAKKGGIVNPVLTPNP